MPVTPFHFGPATLLKALIPSRFSFFVFCYAQIVTDLEVAYHIFTHQVPLHGFSHTFLGAAAIGIFCGITAQPLHAMLAIQVDTSFFGPLIVPNLTFRTSVVSALIGTVSHLFLDSIMHADIKPFWPVTDENPVLGLISLSTLHLGCVLTGIVGVILCEKLMNNPPRHFPPYT